MTSADLLVTAKDGPVSPVFFHFTSIIRELPLASHGLLKDPVPVDPVVQSCAGSGALAEATGAAVLSSLEQPTRDSMAAVTTRARIARILPRSPRRAEENRWEPT